MNTQTATAELLDRKLPAWQEAAAVLRQRPKKGWIYSLRTALGMSATALARKLQVSHPSVLGFEKAELVGRIQLDTLQRVADALDADLVVALVPRRPIKAQLLERAEQLAREELAAVNTTMALENQRVDDPTLRAHYAELVEALLKDTKKLWR